METAVLLARSGGIVGLVFGIIAEIFWIWMLIDAALRPFSSCLTKVVWILVIILLNLVGALIYFFVVYLPARR